MMNGQAEIYISGWFDERKGWNFFKTAVCQEKGSNVIFACKCQKLICQ